MTKSEIKRILEQAEKAIEKDHDKCCDNDCDNCKYDIGNTSCELVHLLHWLSDHDDIIKKFKSYIGDNKEYNEDKNDKEEKEDNNMKNNDNKKDNNESKLNNLKNKDIHKTPEERVDAFKKFCASSSGLSGECKNCMLNNYRSCGTQHCIFYWLELKPNPSGKMASDLVEKVKNSHSAITTYSFVKALFSPEHREEIKAIWAKQDEENNNE